MRLEKVTEANIETAVSVQEELFSGESGRANFEESLEEGSYLSYFLIYKEEECAGVIGLYRYPEDPESAWLGWFGIREGFRRQHLGSEALKAFEAMALSGGYRTARLYTDAEDNDAAIAFYKANGYCCEPYENENDPACREYKTLIFSKPLTSEPLILWNSRNIHLTEQMAKEKKYSRTAKPENPVSMTVQLPVSRGCC